MKKPWRWTELCAGKCFCAPRVSFKLAFVWMTNWTYFLASILERFFWEENKQAAAFPSQVIKHNGHMQLKSSQNTWLEILLSSWTFSHTTNIGGGGVTVWQGPYFHMKGCSMLNACSVVTVIVPVDKRLKCCIQFTAFQSRSGSIVQRAWHTVCSCVYFFKVLLYSLYGL